MNIKRYLLTSLSLVLALLATLLSACGAPTGAGGSNPLPTIAPMATPTAAPPIIPTAPSLPLSEAILKNAKYELPDIGSIQLKEGKFEQKVGEGASRVNRGDFQRMVLGDLNGDGAQDAVVILAVNTGGSGTFVYMVVVVNQNGAPKQVAAEMLGDRAQIKALNISNGQLDVDFLGFGPKDPMCCPSQATTRAYRLRGNTLVKISDSSPATNTGKLTEDMLKNGKYTLPDIGAVQLKDGAFEHKYGDGASQVNKVGYVQAVFSDLNGDKADDAAVILWANTGGSGTFIYLIVATNQNGTPQQVAAQLLGDRVKVQNLAVQNGQIVINALSFGPNDPMCCPSQLVIRTYRLEGGTLKVVSEVKPTAGANVSIVNTVWQWERFDDTAGMNSIKVSDPTKYTLQLLPDGTYQVKADCNLGNGKYELEGNSIKLGPMAMTRAACAPDSLSDKYVARLGDAATFVLRDGKLYLNLKMDAGNMIFRQAGAPASGINPARIMLNTQGLNYPYQPNQVAATPYDKTQPPGPTGLPAHVQVNFGDTRPALLGAGPLRDPILYIIPVQDYTQQWDAAGDPSVSKTIEKLQRLLADKPEGLSSSGMPVLPPRYAVNDLAVQAKYLDTGWATGVRFVGRFAQDANPVTNQNLYYVFQGFTTDGTYLVAMFWPARTASLPNDVTQVPVKDMQQFNSDLKAYLADKVKLLNQLGPSEWETDLSKLDAVLASVTFAK